MKRKKLTYICLLFLLTTHLAVQAQKDEIVILSVNDIHASIDQFQSLKVVADSLRRIYPKFLLVSAGDNRTGNPVSDRYSEPSYPTTALMNATGFNLSCVGNHEFDSGMDQFCLQAEHSNFPYLGANVSFKDSTKNKWIKPYEIIDFEGKGPKIGILGILEINANTLIPDMHPDNAKDGQFADITSTIQQYLWLKDSCDIVILLSHNGYSIDTLLTQRFPGFADIIIGGHSHTLVPDNDFYHGTLVSQAGSHLKYATIIDIKLKNKHISKVSSKNISLKNYPRKDDLTAYLINRFNNNEQLQKVLTTVADDFEEREELGIMVADALARECQADIAIVNSGSVRLHSFPKGPITLKDIYMLDPFSNQAVKFQLNGQQLKQLLINCHNADAYGAAYVSGCAYFCLINPRKYTDILEMTISFSDGSALDADKTYTIVTSSYVATTCMKGIDADLEYTGKTTTDCIINYLSKQKSINYHGRKCVVEIAQ